MILIFIVIPYFNPFLKSRDISKFLSRENILENDIFLHFAYVVTHPVSSSSVFPNSTTAL